MPVNTKIDKTFTYDIPDDYLYQTNDLGLTGEWTYNGVDKLWVLVSKETNKYVGIYYTEAEDGEHIPTPLDMYKVRIDANVDPLFCCLIGADEVRDYAELEQLVEELPDGNTYSRPAVITPDHAYELTDIEYDPVAGSFVKPYPWKKPHMTWEMMRDWRNQTLMTLDYRAPADAPEAVKAQWEAYRQALRDLPQTYGAEPGGTPTIDPWKIVPPQEPGT